MATHAFPRVVAGDAVRAVHRRGRKPTRVVRASSAATPNDQGAYAETVGRVRAHGLDGTFTLSFDPPRSTSSQSFVEEVSLRDGTLRAMSGFDGEKCWDVNWYGDATDEALDGAHLSMLMTWARTGMPWGDIENAGSRRLVRTKQLARGVDAKRAKALYGVEAPKPRGETAKKSTSKSRGNARSRSFDRRTASAPKIPSCPTSVFAVSIVDGGKVGGRVFVDEATGLAWRAEFYHQRGVEQWSFDKWETVDIGGGAQASVPRIAHRIHAEGQVTVFSAETTTRRSDAEAMFRKPAGAVEWAREKSWLLKNNPDGVPLEAMRGEGGHFLVKPRVEGPEKRQDATSWFVVDTATAGFAIAPRVADAVSMESFGSMAISGVAAPLEGALRSADLLCLGAFTLSKPIFMEQSLDGAVRMPNGGELGGVLGCPAFAHTVLSIHAPMRIPGSRDAPKVTVKVIDPAEYAPSNEVERAWMPVIFISGVPYVELEYTIANDGFQGVTEQVMERKGLFKLAIGTGGVGALLSSKVARDADVANRTHALQPGGIMSGPGESSGRLQRVGDEIVTGRVETIRFKGFEFKNIRAVLHLDGDPGDVDLSPHAEGAICADCFRGCELILDFSNNRIAVVPP